MNKEKEQAKEPTGKQVSAGRPSGQEKLPPLTPAAKSVTNGSYLSYYSLEGATSANRTPAEISPTQQTLLTVQHELAQARQELQEARQQLDLLKALNTSLAGAPNPVPLYQVLALEQLSKTVLEQNATPGNSLERIVNTYLAGVERLHPGMLCACMRLEGNKLYTLAAPSLPENFNLALNGTTIGEREGSCGAAAFLGQKIIATNIEHDSNWVDYKDLALSHGLRACWSFPIRQTTGEIIGTLAIYYTQVKAPTPEEQVSCERISNLLQLILENKLAEQALRASNERFHFATLATHDAIYDWDIASDRIDWGVEFENIFGVVRSPETTTLAYWESRIHPADREDVLQSLQIALDDPIQEYWQSEYRYLKNDGHSVGYVAERGYILRHQDRTPFRVVGALQEITARKNAEKELRHLSVIATETINGVLVMTPDLTVLWVNQAFTNITGYTLAEVKGKKPASFLNGPKTDPRTIAYVYQQVALNEPMECELLQYTKAGHTCWIKMQMQHLRNAKGDVERVFAFMTDVTQQKKEEQQLRLMESAITNTHEVVCIARVYSSEPKYKTIFCNKAFLDFTGCTDEEIMGKPPLLFDGPDTNQEDLAAMQVALEQGQPYEAELLGYHKTGETFWAFASIYPICNQENVLTHWIFMMRDITNRKNYEHERELLISELHQNNADLKQFSFITSHNLRAPLSNLQGIINLLDMEALPDGLNKILIQKFAESTVQLTEIIDDLLEILVIKNGVQIKKESLSLTAAFQKVRASVDGLLTETDATLLTNFEGADVVEFNPGYLHSILLNLLTNAIKYRHPDRPLVISVTSVQEKDGIEVRFTDNGLGLDLERYRDRIFGLYQRFHKNKDSKGMGLYIAQSQAKAMGGQLEIESKVNEGTTFILQIGKIGCDY